MAVGPFALTTLADVRLYLRFKSGFTSDDALVEKLIDRATGQIERHTARKLKARALTEFYDGTGTKVLILREKPAVSVEEVNLDPIRNFGTTTIISPELVILSVEEGTITVGPGIPVTLGIATAVFAFGTKNIRVKYTAGFDPIPDDLEFACVKVVAAHYWRSREGADGVVSEATGGRSVTWINGLPTDVIEMLKNFKRNV